MRHKTQNSET